MPSWEEEWAEDVNKTWRKDYDVPSDAACKNEDWFVRPDMSGLCDVYDADGLMVFESRRSPGKEECHLAAAAPAMLRALLEVEFVYCGSNAGYECPWCGAMPGPSGHGDGCARQAAIALATGGMDAK